MHRARRVLDRDPLRATGLHDLPAETEEEVRLAVTHGPDGVDRVQPVLSRWVEAELLLQSVQEVSGRAFPDTHGAVALHVRVAANREEPGSRLPDVALRQ